MSEKSKLFFNGKKKVIGMVHLLPLPGKMKKDLQYRAKSVIIFRYMRETRLRMWRRKFPIPC